MVGTPELTERNVIDNVYIVREGRAVDTYILIIFAAWGKIEQESGML